MTALKREPADASSEADDKALRRDIDRWLDEGMTADQYLTLRMHVGRIREQAATEARQRLTDCEDALALVEAAYARDAPTEPPVGIAERAVALIAALRAPGLRSGDGDRLVIVALAQAATEARRELLAKVRLGFIDAYHERGCVHRPPYVSCERQADAAIALLQESDHA